MQVKAISSAVISHLRAALSCEESVRQIHHEQRKWGKEKRENQSKEMTAYMGLRRLSHFWWVRMKEHLYLSMTNTYTHTHTHYTHTHTHYTHTRTHTHTIHTHYTHAHTHTLYAHYTRTLYTHTHIHTHIICFNAWVLPNSSHESCESLMTPT